MVGFLGAVTALVSAESLRNAVKDSVPPALEKLNLEAFDKGFAYGEDLMKKAAEEGKAEPVVS
jgi:2-oxoglutarate ferredoxin oxidoreductase subunit gamma